MRTPAGFYTFFTTSDMLDAVLVLLTLFSALLLPLALPNELFPWGLALPGLVALVPVLLAVYRSSSQRAASRLGALFGAVSTAIANYWLAFFGDFSVWTIGGAVLGYTIYNYILFGYLYHLIHSTDRSDWYRPLRIALAWTAYEYLKSTGFLGYPWGLVAYPLAAWYPLAQGAELAGVWGLSFLAAWINGAITEFIAARDPKSFLRPRSRALRPPQTHVPALSAPTRHILAWSLVLAVVAGFGLLRLHHLRPPGDVPGDASEGEGEIRVLVVQQNVDSWEPGLFADALAQAQDLTLSALARHERTEGTPVDLVVWSETALRRAYHGPDDYYRTVPAEMPFTVFLELLGKPLITGVPLPAAIDSRNFSNSAVVILPDGSVAGSYAKQQLVPFAESIPFWELPAVRGFFREIVGVYGTWLPGTESTVITLPGDALPPGFSDGLAVGLPICFEDAFGWVPREMVNRGARILINLTNNSWSRQDSAQTQHYVAAQLRAIELRTTLVRGTNSGLSGVIDRRGFLVDSLPMFESTAAVMVVPAPKPQWTLYRLIGDLPGQLAVLYVLGIVVLGAVRRSGRKRPGLAG
ncbi:MAG: apolipoprotein N-acyltransferase [Spirochaetaceae bacterium]|nr:MAG: apolipoprotein N-acyltransferase [Spirochaetaceae bacterium]